MGDKKPNNLKRKLSYNDSYMKTSHKSVKIELPSAFTESSMDTKSAKAWNNSGKGYKLYSERHHVKCDEFLNRNVPKLEHRTSLRKLIEVNRTLDKSQIGCVELMGFGALTRVEIDQLDREVLKWIIYNYDPESSTLNIRSHCYSVNDEDVKIALGVPATSQTIILHTKGTDGLKKYGHLFKIIDGRIDIVTLVGSLKQCTSAGDEFKVMYLALLFGTVLFPSTQHNLPVHYLNPLVVIENIKELNWAGLIRTTLNEGIRKWKNTEHAYIGGSLVFLQVFFFAIVRPPGSHYVFNLAFERPFITFLTKQRVNSLTDDIHKDVPYWNAMECYFALNEISTPNPVDETKVRKEDIDTSENELNEIHDVRGEEFMDFNVDLNVLGDHRVHGDSPSDREKSLNNQGETGELKEDVVCNYRVTQQIGNAYDDSDIKNQLSLLIARVSNIERQAKYVQDDFFIRNQLSLFGARLSGFEQQMTQLMNTMGEVLIRCVTRSASGDQFGDQPSSQENVDKFKDVLNELKILELKIPSMIWDTWDVICRKANNAHISSNVTGQKIEVDTVLKKKIDEDTALKQKIEKDIALKKKIEEDTALKQKIEEDTALKQKIEEDTVLAKKLEKDTVLEKQIEEDIIYIHENEQLISAKEKESPINPIGADFDAIIKFLFDPNLDQSTWVINFGGRGCNRKNLMGLKPCEFIDGIVIDCVAFLCTRNSIEGRMEDARWYFPAIFAQLCLTGNFPDEHIINTIDYCTSRMDDCYQIYLPVNDLRGHWFLAIIDFDNKEVNICDSAASRESNNYRRDLLDQVIIRMEHLIQKWRPKEYAIKNIKDSFSYEYPDWVPRQPNGYDCGLYVCLIMMFEMGAKQLSDEQSIGARQQLAYDLYITEHNRFAWPR